MRLRNVTVALVIAVATALTTIATAQQPAPPLSVLFRNVRVFNGTATSLSGPTNVLVTGNVIKSIGAGMSAAEPGSNTDRDRRRRTHADARPHRRPHAPDALDADDGAGFRPRTPTTSRFAKRPTREAC